MPDIGLLQGGGAPRPPFPPSAIVPSKLREEGIAEIVSEAFTEPRSMAAPVDPARVAAVKFAAARPPESVITRPDAPAPRVPVPGFTLPPIRWSDLLWLALALVLIIGTGIGIRDPWPADEPRFASLARDMALSGEWLFPRVGGDLYQDKPPLFFWLLALCYTALGSVRWSFLIPAFLGAGGVMFLIYDYGRRTVSREAGLAASLLVVCTLQFVLATRGAQIDPVLCFLTTLSLYALLRHLFLGPSWRWYFLGGFAAGLGIFTKGVGFLPVLVVLPFFLLRGFGWKGLAPVDAGRGGWRWWLAPAAMLLAVSLWFVPMLIAVATSGSPEYVAYRDEILFEQTVNRYAGAWHHVKSWYYFLVEVIPLLWLPWSLLLFWLVPRFKSAFHERDARVWLPLAWVLIVLVFFSASPGKRGVYILPALPALAFRQSPFSARCWRARVCGSRDSFSPAFLAAGAGVACGLDRKSTRFRGQASAGREDHRRDVPAPVRSRCLLRVETRASARVAVRARRTRDRILVLDCAFDERRTLGQGLRAWGARAGAAHGTARTGRVQGAIPAVPGPTDIQLWSSTLA